MEVYLSFGGLMQKAILFFLLMEKLPRKVVANHLLHFRKVCCHSLNCLYYCPCNGITDYHGVDGLEFGTYDETN